MQVMLMRLMSKGEYVIVPKGTKFRGAGKLGLSSGRGKSLKPNSLVKIVVQKFFCMIVKLVKIDLK